MFTKVLFIFLGVSCYLATAAPAPDRSAAEVAKFCQNVTGISNADFEVIQRTEIAINESTEAQRCFVACTLSRRGVMKKGNLNVDILVQISTRAFAEEGRKFDEVIFRKGVADCNNTGGDGKCVKSYNTWKCFLEFSMKTLKETKEETKGSK